MKLCPFFYDLQDVMEDRPSTKPLFSSGCELEVDIVDNAVESLEAAEEYYGGENNDNKNNEGNEDNSSVNDKSSPTERRRKRKSSNISSLVDDDTSTIQSILSGKKGSKKKQINSVKTSSSFSFSSPQFKGGGNGKTSMMINLKRKQLKDEAVSQKESSKFWQSEVESTIKLLTAQADKVQAEAKTARIIAKVTLMREQKKLVTEGFTQEEVDEALPLDM